MINLNKAYRFLNKKEKIQELSDILLYLEIIDYEGSDYVFFKDGSVMALYEISGIDYESVSPEQIVEINESIKRYFDLSEGSVLIDNFLIRDSASISEIKSLNNNEGWDFLATKKFEHWNKNVTDLYNNRLYLTIKFQGNIKSFRDFKELISRKRTIELISEDIFSRLAKLKTYCSETLVHLENINLRPLYEEEIFKVLFKRINFRSSPKYRNDLLLNTQLCGSEIKFFKDHATLGIGINNTYISIISIRDLPKESNSLMFSEFWNMGNLHFSISFKKKNKKNLKALLEYRKRGFSENTKNIQYHSNVAFSDMLSECEAYSTGIYFVNIASDLKTLKTKNTRFINILSSYGAKGKVETDYLPVSFFTIIPGHTQFNENKYTILSDTASEFFQKYKLSSGDDDPIDFFIDNDGGIYNFNPFSNKNPASHMAIIGSTGSGKTFRAMSILTSSLPLDPYIFVVDTQESMIGLFQLLKQIQPEYTQILSKEDLRFNPFFIGDEEVTDDRISNTLNLLKLMIGFEVSADIVTALQSSISQFFVEYKQILSSGISEEVSPLYILHSIIENKLGKGPVSESIKGWLSGEKGKIVNNKEDFIRDKKYMYFNLKNFDENSELYKVVNFLVFNKVKEVLGDDKVLQKQKILLLEEVFQNLKLPEFSDQVDFLIRTKRKRNLSVIILTQNLEDLIECDEKGNLTGWSKGILNNIDQLIMFQGNKNIDTAMKKFKMTDWHIELYKNLHKGGKRNFLYWSSLGVVREFSGETDPYTYYTLTDVPVERMLRDKLIEKFGNIKEAIEKLVEINKGEFGTATTQKTCKDVLREIT